MPLEDLTGLDKFIDAFVKEWPLGADSKNEGDDHIRGIKNVLVNTFPNTVAAVDFNTTEWGQLKFWAAEDPGDFGKLADNVDVNGNWTFSGLLTADGGLQMSDGALVTKLVLTQTPGPPTGNSNGTITFVYSS